MNYIVEAEKKTPVSLEANVIVVGGGPAGLAASVAAARNGAKTVLIERYGYLGGMITAGLCPTFMGVDRRIIRGIFSEILDRLYAEKAASKESFFTQFDPEILKFISQDLAIKAGVKLLLHSWVVDAITSGSKIDGVIIENKSGRQAVLGKIIIDASGDGDVAVKAGASFNMGGTPEQTLTMLFRVGGVDMDVLNKLRKENPEFANKPHPPSPPNHMFYRVPNKMVEDARKKGELHLSHETIQVIALPLPGIVLVNAGHIIGMGTNVDDLIRGEIQSREQAVSVVKFLRKNVHGFESSFILDTPIGIGVRESRRIVGEYILVKNDIIQGKRFSDVIAQNKMPIDIHGPGDKHTWIPLEEAYDIPYRCLLPKNIDNLLIAGRCISVDHETEASIRSIPCCFATGQAAGTAAALSIRNSISPKNLKVEILQKALTEQGTILSKK